FECFASTGVNTPPMAKMRDEAQHFPNLIREGSPPNWTRFADTPIRLSNGPERRNSAPRDGRGLC
ncbi:MAG TPA: hypothetical protein VGR84_07505, partial [Candidatus Acidoferrales bacterium]|nr:hypothetical protein [Candidatus Acidoferrales bacterium]